MPRPVVNTVLFIQLLGKFTAFTILTDATGCSRNKAFLESTVEL